MIVIFGAGGQLGQELQRSAAQNAYPYKAFSRSELDITDPSALSMALTDARPTVVVNAAAYTKVDLAETEVEAARLGNEIGPGLIAAACAERQIPLIHISTDYVFDGSKSRPYVESDVVAPLGVYGRTKAAGEKAVREAVPQHIILRTSWVYGEFGNNFLKTMLRLSKERDELRIVADQRGCPTSTRDIANAILQIAPLINNDQHFGTYHFAGAGAASWYSFASHIIESQAKFTRRRPKVTAITTAEYPTPARRPANSVFDCSCFEKTFGFIGRSWEEEVDEILKRLFIEA